MGRLLTKPPRRYGLPYMGSKNAIAAAIVELLPSARHFYDLFAGGGAITHAAMLSGKWEVFHMNDIRADIVQLFADCVSGKRPTAEDWRAVSREEFHTVKARDALVRQVWSFGNNGECYLWGADIEEVKLAAHRMLTAETVTERYRHYRKFIKLAGELDRGGLERLQGLQGLERLQGAVEVTSGDYQAVDIEPDALVYCDPPYRGCADDNANKRFYKVQFDFDRFDAWLRAVDFPVYVSEYTMPEDFVCIWQREKMCSLGAGNRTPTGEKLFVHERFAERFLPKPKEFEELELFDDQVAD